MADPTDLVALPALVLVPWIWQSGRALPARERTLLATAVAGLGCIATSVGFPPDVRWPADGARATDPARPMILRDGEERVYAEAPAWGERLSVVDEEGVPVPFVLGSSGHTLAICPVGGLEADRGYRWTVRPRGDEPPHVLQTPSFGPTGTWSFTTGAPSSRAPIDGADACAAYAASAPTRFPDTGPVASTADTGGP